MAIWIRRRRFALQGAVVKKPASPTRARRHGEYLTLSVDPALRVAAGSREVSEEIVDALAGPCFRAWLRGDGKEFDNQDWKDYVAARDQRDPDFDEVSEEFCSSDADEDMNIEEEQKPEKFNMDLEISNEEYMGFLDLLPTATPYVDDMLQLDIEQRIELYERHALYRIKACKLLQGEPIGNLDDDKLLLQGEPIGDLDDDKLRRMYPPQCLKKNRYFKCYEEDGTLGWFFHPDNCQLAALDDYQRLVLLNDGGYEYIDWDGYRSSYHTYEIDREYVKYCETISKEIKWIEDYVALDSTCRDEWFKLRNRAAGQAMKIATCFTKISVGLAHLAFMEYTSNLCHDFYNHKELDGVYFEIWKRVTKEQNSFRDALNEVYELKKFPLRQPLVEYALLHGCSELETQFRSCTAGIHGKVHEDKAHRLITKRVRAMFKNAKGYEEYARKKIKIAELIGLVPKV